MFVGERSQPREKSDGDVGLGTLLYDDLQGGGADVRNNQNTSQQNIARAHDLTAKRTAVAIFTAMAVHCEG